MGFRIGLIIVGLFNIANGLFMLVNPDAWFTRVIGDMPMGMMDDHFIRDVGFAYLASGVGFLWGLRPGATAAAFALAGSIWPVLHAFFHLDLWAMNGIPQGMKFITEGIGVIVISFAGLAIAWLRFRQGETS
jgi:uncharacterized protein YjeT (DUF2065 family)